MIRAETDNVPYSFVRAVSFLERTMKGKATILLKDNGTRAKKPKPQPCTISVSNGKAYYFKPGGDGALLYPIINPLVEIYKHGIMVSGTEKRPTRLVWQEVWFVPDAEQEP